MKRTRGMGWAVLALLVVGAGPATVAVANDTESVPNSIVRANTDFALELYSRLAADQDNVAFAPYGVSSGLGLVCAGARGATEAAMLKTLCLESIGRVNADAAFGVLNRSFGASKNPRACEVHLANAVWAEKRFALLPDFVEVARGCYGAEATALDFTGEPAKARETINTWVSRKTKGKIAEILESSALDRSTRVVLTNALYFKGLWAFPFQKDQTRSTPFTLLSGEKKPVKMMTRTETFAYMENDAIQAVSLPYAARDYAMVLLLPKDKKGLAQMEKGLDAEVLANTIRNLQPRPVELHVPRFRVRKAVDLSNTLAYMGMNDAFTPAADFSGMASGKELFISAVLHQTYVDVNETGTEAAAATATMLASKALQDTGKKVVFRADHPFLFLIREERTGTILFLGRLAKP
jgi:serpin B